METTIEVHVDLDGRPCFAGTLWTRAKGRHESASFEYERAWLADPRCFALEPALSATEGPHHTPAGHALFGSIGDSAPDRWGRLLIQRRENYKAREAKRGRRTLSEADYLLGVGDYARQGALRFKLSGDGEFLASGEDALIPPLIQLPKLLAAAMRVDDGGEDDNDLRLLFAPGSSLGGARPKASVMDKDGGLAIAKFPKSTDERRIPLWEALALKLARAAGINTPASRIEIIRKRPVLLLGRFDRDGGRRIPFLSAMSMLGASDHGEAHSYMELADALRRHGARPAVDCRELWRRIVFNVMISNTDDHLRNHGFLLASPQGWRLAPAYDLNPTPMEEKPRILSLAINETDATASLDLAMGVAGHFGLKTDDAAAIAREVGSALRPWRKIAGALGLNSAEIDRMQSAFVLEGN